MKLPIKILEKKEEADYYLALILRNEKATAIVFEKTGNTVKYISHAEEEFASTVEDASEEEFLDVLDKSITRAESALPENIETHKTVFGLKENWILEEKIKPEYLEKLKKAGDELSLKPIGFITSSETIVNLVQKEEGAPATAIIADIGKKHVTVSLVKAGKIIETKSSEIHESPSYTVDTLLKHFQTPEVLPARVILLDSDDEELAQEFIGHTWSKSLPFLHLPQISPLSKDSLIKGMLLGAATQMNAELSYASASHIEESDGDAPPKKLVPEKEEVITDPATETKEVQEAVKEDSSAEFFGFTEGADIAKTPIPSNKEPELTSNLQEAKIREAPEEVKLEEERQNPTPVNVALVTEKIKTAIPVILVALKKIKIGDVLAAVRKPGGMKFALIPVVIVALLLVILFFYLFNTKAAVTIFVSPKEASKTTEVTFSPDSETSIDDKTIASEFVEVSEEGSTSVQATGKKDVGNPAKGAVTVFNNGDDTVNLKEGTVIKSSNGLEFTFDKAISIASASGDIFSGTKPGTATVNVTASKIGQEYNLPSGSKFAIGSSTTLAAKNDNAYSGGTKKQVTVVSDADLTKLEKELPKKLADKAREDIKGKVSSDRTLLGDFVSQTLESQTFSKKVDDEASEVSIKGTVAYKAATYTNEDIQKFASSLFDSSDTEVSKENLSISAKNIKVEKNDDVTADLDVKVKLLPKIDTSSLSKEIAGTSNQKATNILSNIDQVENVEIVLKPNFPFLPDNLPGNSKNINIKVTSK